MRLVFITREGYHLSGARVRCYNFSRELAKYGIDTEILSFSDTLGAKDGEEESQMKMRAKIGYNWKAFRRLVKEREALFCIQRFNYHSFAPYLAHLLNKNRIIFDLDDWEMRENPKYYLGLYPSSKAHYLTRKIARSSIFCIVASRFLQEFLLQFNKKVYYLPSGVDTELFKPRLNNRDNNRVVFSWIGTFNKQEYFENIKFALDCFNKLRQEYSHIYFEITGDGTYRNSVTKAVLECSDPNIHIKEWSAPHTMPEYLTGIDIGLFPVASRTKFNKAKSPTRLFEYMAMEKPVVVSAIGEATQIIHEGENGFLAKTKDDFIFKIRKLVENKTLRDNLGKNARKTVIECYALDKVVEKLVNEIRKL